MQPNIYTHSHFDPDEFSNGGCKRTAQIREILNKNEISYTVPDLKLMGVGPKNFFSYVKGAIYNKQPNLSIRNDLRIGNNIKLFDEFIDQRKPSAFIWESISEYYLLLARQLHKKNIPFIALPHNIESLVSGNKSFSSGLASPAWFAEELKYLKFSDRVFTISLEEQWLLSLYGIDADYLPYYPTKAVVSYLMTIREEREKKKKDGAPQKILLLGTFYNNPTLQGYVSLLQHASKFNDLSINVAGFGSEALSDLNIKNVKIWGTVTNEVLKELLIDNDAVVLHQQPTTGALTKIPELLIAGIPIIANHTASRSYHNVAGVATYFSFTELFEVLRNVQIPPSIPQPPLQAEKRFTDTIASFHSK